MGSFGINYLQAVIAVALEIRIKPPTDVDAFPTVEMQMLYLVALAFMQSEQITG
jgi:hypothetical protein